jgi:hypothetical protein
MLGYHAVLLYETIIVNVSVLICRFTKYTITSLEKMYKPQLYVEPDLGIPLDLLDLSVYKYNLSTA